MTQQVIPSHYSVEKAGQADPAPSDYFILNVTQDPLAREALAFLGNKYLRNNRLQLAQECFDLLDSTRAAFAEVMARRQPKKKK